MSENIKDYKKFLEEFKIAFAKHEKRCKERRRRGIHDLNIFDVLETKEVKHSKFLSALLDPDGLHYQNDLFLREFVDICELKDFDFDTSRAKVYREYNNIDIYITDGDKHIIIENKLWTIDHDEQIARYIQAIVDEQDEQDGIYERILVLYLTPFDDEIKSLGGIDEVGKGYLKLGQNQVVFRHISYKNEILKWIGKIKAEIANLIDLSVIITQYEKIVKNLTNQGEKMENSKLKDLVWENYEICDEICAVVSELKIEKVDDFFKNYLYKELEKGLKNNKNWELADYMPLQSTSWGDVIYINPKISSKFFLHYTIQPVDSIKNVCWGILKNNSALPSIKEIIEKNNIQISEKRHRDVWWVFAKYFYNNEKYGGVEFALYLFKNKDNLTEIAKEFCNKILTTIKELDNEIKIINDILAKEKIKNDE